jgi:hypothetical protein
MNVYIYIIFIILISLIKTTYVYIHTQHVDIYILLPGTPTAIFMALVLIHGHPEQHNLLQKEFQLEKEFFLFDLLIILS